MGLISALFAAKQMFILCDAGNRRDTPIVFASKAFCLETGFSRDTIMGKNCRFLQGKETSRDSVRRVREAMKKETPSIVCLTNYKLSGEKFYNQFFIAPIYDTQHQIVLYLGIQRVAPAITSEMESVSLAQYLEEATTSPLNGPANVDFKKLKFAPKLSQDHLRDVVLDLGSHNSGGSGGSGAASPRATSLTSSQ